MTPAKLRLLLAAALFSCWLGWLAFLAFTAGTVPGPPGVRKEPVILSRPQFLDSTLDVVAQVEVADDQPNPQVKVVEVLWPKAEEGRAGAVLTVTNLGSSKGWTGRPGEYLLPLKMGEDKQYQVASIPHYPGLDPHQQRPHIYPYNAEIRAQYREIQKPAVAEPHAQP
jgi:hypothetical protein